MDDLISVSLQCTPPWWATASDADRAAALARLLDLGAASVNANSQTLEVVLLIPQDMVTGFDGARDAIRERIIGCLARPN